MVKPDDWEGNDLLRAAGRRRLIGAAIIMLVVVILLPMLLNHSQTPKVKADVASDWPPAMPLKLDGSQSTSPPTGVIGSANLNAPLDDHGEPYSSKADALAMNDHAPTAATITPAPLAKSQDTSTPINDKPALVTASQSPKEAVTVKKPTVENANLPVQINQPESPPSPSTQSQSPPLVSEKNQEETKKESGAKKTEKILQLGLFAQEERAKSLMKEVKHHGLHPKMETLTLHHQPRYRVYIGPFTDLNKMHLTKKKLSGLGYSSLIKDHHL